MKIVHCVFSFGIGGAETIDVYKRQAELLDDVACLSSDYRFYMNIGGSYHCLKFRCV